MARVTTGPNGDKPSAHAGRSLPQHALAKYSTAGRRQPAAALGKLPGRSHGGPERVLLSDSLTFNTLSDVAMARLPGQPAAEPGACSKRNKAYQSNGVGDT